MTRPLRDPVPGALGAVMSLCLAILVAVVANPVDGQEPPVAVSGVQAATAVDPDTVRVGEVFVLGVTVRAPPGTRVAFPPVLALDEQFEQRGPVEQRAEPGSDGTQRAYYSLVAWTAGSHTIPAFEIAYADEEDERRILVQPPSIVVSSVLPADAEGLELRAARPFLRATGFPWWWLVLAVAAAALGYWLWHRHRTGGVFRGAPMAPAALALSQLEELRTGWAEGAMRGGEFFDGLEGTLRDYARATRDWLPGLTLRGLANGNERLAEALRRSTLVRFARLTTPGEAPLEAVDAGIAWVQEDSAEPQTADADEQEEPASERAAEETTAADAASPAQEAAAEAGEDRA